MAILPATPIGVGSGMGLLGKVGATVVKLNASLLLHAWLLFAQFAPFSLLVSWFSKQQAESIVDTPEQQYRKTLWKRHATTVILTAITVGGLSYAFTHQLGVERIFQLISLYTLYGFWMVSKLLKVNRSRYAKAQVATLAIMFITCVLVGFFEFPPFTFIGGMIVVNLLLTSAHRELPQRMDYNLFLRAATGGSREAPFEIESSHEKLTNTELKAFARLLGELWLVRDYHLTPSGITLRIPPVRNSIGDLLRSTGLSQGSSLHLDHSGRCKATIDQKDLDDIEQLQGEAISSEELTACVERSIEASLGLFLEGRSQEARKTLRKIPDEEIFKSTVISTESYKKLCYISVGAAIVSFTLSALIHFLMN